MSRWPLALAAALLATQPVPLPAQQMFVYRIPVTGTIELGLAPYIARGIEQVLPTEYFQTFVVTSEGISPASDSPVQSAFGL